VDVLVAGRRKKKNRNEVGKESGKSDETEESKTIRRNKTANIVTVNECGAGLENCFR
jgi:hypothetical protein